MNEMIAYCSYGNNKKISGSTNQILPNPRLLEMVTPLLFDLGVFSCRQIERFWVYLHKRLR